MRQLTVTAANTLEWLEVAAPALKDPHGALVRPVAAAVCDFDRAVVTGGYPALPYPIAIGHEMVAEVVEAGAEVGTLRPGQRVALPLHVSCGACESCRRRRTNSCLSRPPLSNYGLGARGGDWGGAMSDLVYVPWAEHMAAPLPPGVEAVDAAALGCNLADLYRTLTPYLDAYPDPRVLIVSGRASNMAFYGVAMARALGISDVTFLDDEGRLPAAEALGARALPVTAPPRETFSIVIDASGMADRLALAVALTGPDGVCTPVWPYVETFALPVGAMFRNNATVVTGQPHARAQMDAVFELMVRTGFSSRSIPHEVLPWEDAPRAYGFGETKRIFVRD